MGEGSQTPPGEPSIAFPLRNKIRFRLGKVFLGERGSTEKQRHHESNLVWGPLGIGVSIVITVAAAMKHDLRGLLIIAWPCFVFGIWKICKYIPYRRLSLWITAASGILLAYGLVALSDWLKPNTNQPTPIANASRTAPKAESGNKMKRQHIPWLLAEIASYSPDEPGLPESVTLGVGIVDYPEQPSDAPRYDSLYKLHVLVMRPVVAWPLDRTRPEWRGWDSCLVLDAQSPEWNIDDMGKRLATVAFKTDVIALVIRASVRGGQWLGALVLKRHTRRLDSDEWITGVVPSASGDFADLLIHQQADRKTSFWSGSKAHEEYRRLAASQWDALVRYGLPIKRLTKDEIRKACHSDTARATELFIY